MADNTGIHPLRSLKSGVSLILAGVALAAVCFGAGFFTGGRSQEDASAVLRHRGAAAPADQPAGHHPVRLHQHGPV